eukprot:591708-Amphidinium_carterae.2
MPRVRTVRPITKSVVRTSGPSHAQLANASIIPLSKMFGIACQWSATLVSYLCKNHHHSHAQSITLAFKSCLRTVPRGLMTIVKENP